MDQGNHIGLLCSTLLKVVAMNLKAGLSHDLFENGLN